MKYETFATYAEAKAAAPPEGFQRIRDDFAYNAGEAGRSLSSIQTDAASWHIIGGEIYWTMPMKGREEGMKILHRLELMSSCLHNGPFWRLCDTTRGEAFLLRNEDGEIANLKRSRRARRIYAENGWTVTTEAAIYNLAEKDEADEWTGDFPFRAAFS